jgi:NADH:ubiquinone oxidoreductase subunit D
LKLHSDITDKRAIKRFENLESDFNRIHNGFYDYSISIYKNRHTKFNYTCPEHNVQETTAGNHLRGKGCKYCAHQKAGSYHKFDENKFIKKAENVHGCVYDYSNIKYTNIHTPIEIICKTHGSFFQSPNNK